jgi:ABC-type bacteriocin/lantibiotic exporter with double-glycine peptidase domain
VQRRTGHWLSASLSSFLIPLSSPTLRQSLRDLGRLARLFRGEWPTLGRAGALSLVSAALGLAVPLVVAALFDHAYPAGNVSLLGLLVAGLLAAKAGEGVVQNLYRFTAFAARVRMRDLARLALFNHVLHLPARVIERRRTGEIAARFQDVRDVLDTGADAALTAMSGGIFLLVVPPVLFLLDPRLALVALVSVPLTALVTAGLGTVANRHWSRTFDAYDEWSAFRVEAIREARTFQSMGCEAALYRRARTHVAAAHAGTVQATQVWFVCNGANALLRAANLAALTYVGWRFVMSGSLSLGAYVAFQAYAALLLAPLAALIDAGGALQKAAVSLARVFSLADEPTDADPAAALLAAPSATAHSPLPAGSELATGSPSATLTGHLRLRRLRFRYAPDAPAISLPDLDLAPSEAVALVGPSGCGKTTLLRLLARIEAPDAGTLSAETLSADGTRSWRPVSTIAPAAWRRQIAACWQEPGLLSSSVRDNLLVATEGVAARPVTDDDLRAVLDTCALSTRLDALAAEHRASGGPYAVGLDARLTEGAGALSAGERQRLALARTLLRVRLASVPIRLVLLDEVTANLDDATAHTVLSCILDELRAAESPPAILLVSHQAEHAALADCTVRLSAPLAAGGDGQAGLVPHVSPS